MAAELDEMVAQLQVPAAGPRAVHVLLDRAPTQKVREGGRTVNVHA